MTTPTLTLEQGRDALKYCHSFNRLPTLLSISPIGSVGRMDYPNWYTLLGEEWSVCDNIGLYRKDIKLCMFLGCTPHTCPEMMNDHDDPERGIYNERAAFAALPERVTIYRGCGPSNMIGCCWSLDRDTAASFPLLNRYQQSEPRLVTATVKRDRIVALKLDRNEQEVITFNARRVSVEPLAFTPMAVEM